MAFDPVTFWTTAKALSSIARDAGKLELYQQALELQAQVGDLIEEDRRKATRIHELEEQLRIKNSVTFRRNAYWTGESDEPSDGPYCATCYGADGKLLHLTGTESNPAFRHCGKCGKTVEVFPERRSPPDRLPPAPSPVWNQDF